MKIKLSGKRFGRLVVIGKGKPPERWKSKKYWSCQCDCGKITNVYEGSLIQGRTKSCGCFRKEFTGKSKTTHGLNKTKTHLAWKNMKGRCYNPQSPAYKDYGGRGITVCESWRNSFQTFLDDMGQCPRGLTIERIDNNGNYSPENCKWATPKEQAINKRCNVNIVYTGVMKTLSEWAKLSDIKYSTLYARLITRKWSAEKALGSLDIGGLQ